MELKLRDFEAQILYFNGMYKLPVAQYPTVFKVIEDEVKNRPIQPLDENPVRGKIYIMQRVEGFIRTIHGEVKEGYDIIQKIASGTHIVNGNMVPYEEIDFLTDMADWLGDLIVYSASEMAKYGIPQKETLALIMQSNFSKLQKDGTATYDSNGKVEKGPFYFKPEPLINLMLIELRDSSKPIEGTKELNEDEKQR